MLLKMSNGNVRNIKNGKYDAVTYDTCSLIHRYSLHCLLVASCYIALSARATLIHPYKSTTSSEIQAYA